MENVALVLAAGEGERFSSEEFKPFVQLKGKPILAHTLTKFEKAENIDAVILLTHENRIKETERIVSQYGFNKVINIFPGGDERPDTVQKGLENLPPDTMLVTIHDGVRPLIQPSIIDKATLECTKNEAVVVGVKVKDTIKLVSDHNFVLLTPPRERLYAIQTPQVFSKRIILKAYEETQELHKYTDDASIVEELGYKVEVVEGNYSNIKITTPQDLDIARALWERRFE